MQIKLSVKVGSNEDEPGKEVIWPVTCMGEDLTSFTVNIYQGPQIVQVQFDYVNGSWSSEIVPLKTSTDASLPLELASNRRTIVEIEVEHELPVVLPVKFELTDTDNSILPKEADDKLSERESGFMTNYLSRTVFVMDSLDLSNNTMRLIVDSEQKHPELKRGQQHDCVRSRRDSDRLHPKLHLSPRTSQNRRRRARNCANRWTLRMQKMRQTKILQNSAVP